LKINSAEYVGSFVRVDQLPEAGGLELAMLGRSNVGKSSLINKLLGRRHLAKSSSTPGKTRTLNYYAINGSWYIVDLPGYGYAKAAKTEKQRWGKMIEQYLVKRETLSGLFLLLDIRHAPSKDDQAMCAWLQAREIPFLLVANKTDKLSRSQQKKQLLLIIQTLALPPEHDVICFSAVSGEGVEALWETIDELMAAGTEFQL
jgi:GTP-binding protein